MTPALRAVVEEAYGTFARYQAGATLTVCHCNVCMARESERLLVQTPLREIPARLLAEYTNSAHGWDDGNIREEMRYFLPRYLELIALGEPPDHLGPATCLRRLEGALWRETWPATEAEVLHRFFDELLLDSLLKLDIVQWHVGWRLTFDLADVLTLVVRAGGDVDRVLRTWDAAPDPPAAVHIAALRSEVQGLEHGYRFDSFFLGDYADEADRIGAFLMRPELGPRLEAAFFQLEDPRLQRIVSDLA